MSLLSPGVEVVEIDSSMIAPTVSNSIACFSGNFTQGPVGVYMLITNETDLVSYYGKPTMKNYNDWMQASTFLKYGNKLFISRACNTTGITTEINGVTVTSDVSSNANVPLTGNFDSIKEGDYIAFGDTNGPVNTAYVVMAKTTDSITVDRPTTIVTSNNNKIYTLSRSINSVFDTVSSGDTPVGTSDYIRTQVPILNYGDFENKESSLIMNNVTSKLKFIAKNPGAWGNNIEIAIANSSDFGNSEEAFTGIALDDLFEYYPTGSEIGIIIKYNDVIQETYVVSFDVNAKGSNGKSIYVEDVINTKSNFVFVKNNTDNLSQISSYLASTSKTPFNLVAGTDSIIDKGDLSDAYNVWSNKEEVDVDIIIGNEFDGGISAKNLVDTRKDCLAFIGANYGDTVGQKASNVISNLIKWRKIGSLNFDDMFVVAGANYVYQYNKYLDKNVWINIACHIAGLNNLSSVA